MKPEFTQRLADCRHVALAGGKAVNLGRLLRAEFPVPEGFAVTTLAYRRAQEAMGTHGIPNIIPEAVADEIRAAYRQMGQGPVAVRSSATAEDMAGASMAGQYDTFLDIEGEAALLETVRRCWASLGSPWIAAYLKERQMDPAQVAMAVVVQRLVAAEVAGVLFTANPQSGGRKEMLIEASWGLGEAVVSGRVQPDVLRLDHESGRVLSTIIGDKAVQFVARGPQGEAGERPVNEGRRREACLSGRDVDRLWTLGRRVAAYFGSPQDIEWAIGEGDLYLLQARPITTLGEIEAAEEVLEKTRQQLREASAAGCGPWALHNLAETLPHPTPLTWSVMGRFMSGEGGFGTLYRQVGFAPAVGEAGFLQCIAGRIYMDAARAPEMFAPQFPFAYDLEELKRRPDASQMPPTLPRGTVAARWKAARRLAAVGKRLHALAADCDRRLREEAFPAMAGYVAEAKRRDLKRLSPGQWIALWQQHEARVMDVFGAQSLLPSLIASMAMGELSVFLAEHFWNDDADALARRLSSGVRNRTLMADAELYDVGQRTQLEAQQWIEAHGHRGAGEFDLAAPRWREQPATVREMAARLATGESPLERHRQNSAAVEQKIKQLREQLPAAVQGEFDERLTLVRRYMAFREDAKDFLMLGYELLRDLALEAGQRLEIGEDVFYLTREELFEAIRTGFAPYRVIEERKRLYRAETRLHLPRVIDRAAIDSLGQTPAARPTTGGHLAMAISAGETIGPARLVRSPAEAKGLGKGYILVCPSTDPSWSPLFVNAAGLVLERGGVLSHGAVVAREMGLPAVVLADAMTLFQEGQEIRVDGIRGWVGPAEDVPALTEKINPEQTDVAAVEMPPPTGRQERRAAKARNAAGLFWLAYLLAFFLLPERWVYQPTLAGIDAALWPLVRAWGRPAVVAAVAAGVALMTLLVQRFATDNRRLREAKRRAAMLQRQAEGLPAGSRRRVALRRIGQGVQMRTLAAAMVPVGLLLGPMVMPFVWFKERMDPATWNAPAGSAVQVVAKVEGEWTQPVMLASPVALDETTPAARTLPPLRQTLEHLLALYRQPRGAASRAWEFEVAPDLEGAQSIADLEAYLKEGIPPQGITWQLRPMEGQEGRFPVTVTTTGHRAITVEVVLGDQTPPAPRTARGEADSPLEEVRVVYPRAAQAMAFWRPLAWMGDKPAQQTDGGHGGGWTARLAAFDIGWLWLYVVVYLPILLLLRALLRVA